jgi:hypothetical protein
MSQWMRAVSPPLLIKFERPLFKYIFIDKYLLHFQALERRFFPFFEKAETRPAHVRGCDRAEYARSTIKKERY